MSFMKMNRRVQRTAPVTVRTQIEDVDTRGEFTALVSMFGVVDSYGDIVEKGAFERSLAEWTIKKRLPPVVWSHQFTDPENFLGVHKSLTETDEGLLVVGQLNLNRAKAAQVHDLFIEGSVSEFSWSGLVREATPVDEDLDPESFEAIFGPQRFKDIDLWEAGPCFKGANPETELVSVKTDPRLLDALEIPEFRSKAGRVLSKANLDALMEARDKLTSIIDSAAPDAAAEDPEPESDEPASKTDDGPKLGRSERTLRAMEILDQLAAQTGGAK